MSSQPVTFVHHINDCDSIQMTGIEGLTSGRRIKSCPIEINTVTVLPLIHDGGFEVGQVGIDIVKSISHGSPGARSAGADDLRP